MKKINTLFTDPFPIIKDQNELDAVIRRYLGKKMDTYYISSGCIADRKEKIDNLWNIFHPHADPYFLDQYKLQFHQRTWEMFVGCVFIKNDFRIKSLKHGPDFCINDRVYVECIACNNAKKGKIDYVPELAYGIVQDVPSDKIIIRITSAIEEKYKKYKNWLDIDISKPYIIAVNSGIFHHPQDYMGIPLIIKALFGVNFLHIKQNGEKFFSLKKEHSKNNAKVPLNYFTTDKYKEISGIIFSDKDIINHENGYGNDCFFVNNPYAVNQVDLNDFKFFKNWRAETNKLIKLYDGGLQLNFN